jgi:hypothetical protein
LRSAKNLKLGQLAVCKALRGVILPDGSTYDGRFNLEADLKLAAIRSVNIEDPASMAQYYGVSIEQYQIGQQWRHHS